MNAVEPPLELDDLVGMIEAHGAHDSLFAMESDARDVRPGEQLDWARSAAWLRERLPACGVPGAATSAASPRCAQFPGGHSNLTYLVRFGDVEIVVRRPPFGPVPPTAHDMAREFRWLAAMHGVFPLAPRPYLLCEDLDVIGSVFYVMERRRGMVVRAEEPPALAESRRAPTAQRGDDRHARRSARDRRHRAAAERARQTGRLRRAPGARLVRTLASIEDDAAAGNGRARRVAARPPARRSGDAVDRPRRLQARQRACSIPPTSAASSRCSTGR